jgi:hypothetical protein
MDETLYLLSKILWTIIVTVSRRFRQGLSILYATMHQRTVHKKIPRVLYLRATCSSTTVTTSTITVGDSSQKMTTRGAVGSLIAAFKH